MLLESKNEATFEKVANQFSDRLLNHVGFPIEYSNFLIDILSEPKFYAKEGAFHFLAIVGVDTDIMSSVQLKNISDAIESNFINYNDEMLCLTACDFIARYYPNVEARRILLRLKQIEGGKAEKGFVDDGLRILDTGEMN